MDLSDRVVLLTERIAEELVKYLQGNGLIHDADSYLERYVNEILADM